MALDLIEFERIGLKSRQEDYFGTDVAMKVIENEWRFAESDSADPGEKEVAVVNATIDTNKVTLSRLRAAGYTVMPVQGMRTNLVTLNNKTVAFWTPGMTGKEGLLTVLDENVMNRLQAH
ncbi:hypothetical protein HS125_15195 [bacterium]|nr:hypothetical protein [bacterium]